MRVGNGGSVAWQSRGYIHELASPPNSTEASAYTSWTARRRSQKPTLSTMSTSPTTPAIRIVPGAPPPPPASKSKNKKKKAGAKKSSDLGDEHVVVPDAHTAALIDHAPSESDVKEGSVAPSLVARQESLPPVSPGGADEPKASPIVDMLNKRLKATGKKIVSTAPFLPHPAI